MMHHQQQQQRHHRLSFVCINDVYSFDDADDNNSQHPRGGWSRASTLMKQLVQQKQQQEGSNNESNNTTVLSVVNGDVLGGSSLLVNCEGAVAIEVMNDINIDLAVLGNHEFDYGDKPLLQRLKESNFDWLGSNVYYPPYQADNSFQEKISDDQYYFPNVLGNGKIYNLSHNLKLGVFGLVTIQTPKISCPSKEVTFDNDILAVARRTSQHLKSQGANIIVAITHLSEADDKLLAADKLAGVDLILGGHEHEPLATMVHRNQHDDNNDDTNEELEQNYNEGGVLIFKCGMNAYWVGDVTLDIIYNTTSEENGNTTASATSTSTSISTSWSMHAVNSRIKEDPSVSTIVKRYRRETDEKAMISAFGKEIASTISLDDVVATLGDTATTLDTRMSSVRRREATGGNLIADAMHWMLETYMYADKCNDKLPMLAMINGGFIRGDRLYKAGSILTIRDVLKELPFPRTMKVLEIEGCHLIDALTQQLKGSSKGPTGAYPHLSSNARLRYELGNSSSDNDEGINITSFAVDGVPISDKQKYLIAVTCFVAGGNEGCTSWRKSNCIQNAAWDNVNMACIFMKYLQSHSIIHPVLEERVKLEQ